MAITSSHRVENLKRHTNYTFYVRAYIHKSASDQSERVWCSTGAPPTPPTPSQSPLPSPTPAAASSAPAVTLTPLSPTALRVAWRKPTPDVAARPVNLYKIQYRRHGARQFDIEVVKGPQSLFISSFEESSVLNLLALPSFT